MLRKHNIITDENLVGKKLSILGDEYIINAIIQTDYSDMMSKVDEFKYLRDNIYTTLYR